MSHYSEDPRSVRVDIFKPSGKWYATIALKWDGPYFGTDPKTGKISLLPDVFRDLLKSHLVVSRDDAPARIRFAGMTAVCLEPYHEHAVPLLMPVPGCYECGCLKCQCPEEDR